MNCSKVSLTDICKECRVGNTKSDCPTYREEDSAIKYAIPPHTIFNLVPYKNHVGEQVICIEDCCGTSGEKFQVKRGEIFTVIKQENEHFGYIWLDKFKDYPLMWFGSGSFKKLKATYNGIEYTCSLRS
jgi:hypothetical protein